MGLTFGSGKMETVGILVKNNFSSVWVEERMGGKAMKTLSTYDPLAEVCSKETRDTVFREGLKNVESYYKVLLC